MVYIGGTTSEGMLMRRSVRMRPTGGISDLERRFDSEENEGFEEAFFCRYAMMSLITGLS
jgi:hypothetical protein